MNNFVVMYEYFSHWLNALSKENPVYTNMVVESTSDPFGKKQERYLILCSQIQNGVLHHLQAEMAVVVEDTNGVISEVETDKLNEVRKAWSVVHLFLVNQGFKVYKAVVPLPSDIRLFDGKIDIDYEEDREIFVQEGTDKGELDK